MVNFFQKIIDTLDELNIAYMLSGSVAMSIYIVPRATRDIDFIIHLEPKNIDRFIHSFHEGYYCDRDAIYDALKHHSLFNIIDYASGFKADFVILKDEAFRLEEFRRKSQIDYFDKSVYVVSPEDLLISKLIWIQDLQSSQQMEDIINLSTLEQLDWPYINKWINKLNLKSYNLLTHE